MWGIKAHNTLKLKIMPSEARLKKFEIYKINILFMLIITSPNIFPVLANFSLCQNKIPCVFPVWKSKNQIPCFPCAVATLYLQEVSI